MADLAQLGVAFDTTGLREGKAALEAIAPAAQKAETATENLAAAAAGAATAVKNEAAAAATGAANNNNLAMGLAKAATANDNVTRSARAAAGATTNLSGQVGNLSAQFGDIAVQLAGGQSPFQIALQQGLQLIGIFGNAGLGAVVRGLGSAFLALVSPLSLITIGIITLGGYVVQYLVGWITQGSEANLTIKEQQELIRGLQDAWGTGIPAIDNYIAKLDEAKAKADALAAVKIVTGEQVAKDAAAIQELNVAITAIRTDLIAYGDEGVNASAKITTAFNSLIQKVTEGKATQEDFNAVVEAANAASSIGVQGIEGFIATLLKLQGVAVGTAQAVAQANNQISAATNAALQNPLYMRSAGIDYTTRNQNEGGSSEFPPLPINGPTPGGRGTPELGGFPWEDFNKKAGRAASGTKEVRTELQLLTQAYQKMSEPFNQAKAAFSALDSAYKNGSIGVEDYTKQLDGLKAAFIAAGGDSEQWAKITTESTKKVTDATSEAKSITKGFLSDLYQGIRDGKGVWESFGNAAMNVLDKIVDKLLNDVVDALFQTNSAAKGAGGGGGFWSSLLGGIGKLFSAKGNVFDGGKAMAFANGGAFTNGIVNRPTAFNLGVMGEAGPEAIVPLARGSDGSLGVKMHSANAGKRGGITLAPQTTNQFVLQGAISEETVIARIQAAAEKTKEDTQKEMIGWLNQYNRDGAFA